MLYFPLWKEWRYFNPRSREGSDGAARWTDGRSGYFNPRSREGSDIPLDAVFTMYSLFQSTLPRRERLHYMLNYTTMYKISIHAPAKGATMIKYVVPDMEKFQSTLPRRERPATL